MSWKDYNQKNWTSLLTKFFHFLKERNITTNVLLIFINKEYEWVLKDYSTASYHVLTLTEIIDSDKEFVKNNPKLFDQDFLKDHPHV